jgi:hypothetical protein
MAKFTDSFGKTLLNIHNPRYCAGRGCCIHHPSEHHMREWPLKWRVDRKAFERICKHNVGPDDLRWQIEFLEDMSASVHGCDGCCQSRSRAPGEVS